MSEFFSKLKINAAKTAQAAKKTSGEAVEKIRINKDIFTRKSELSKLLGELSKRYYEMWKQEKVDFDEIDGICQKALDKEEEILKLQLELKNVGAESLDPVKESVEPVKPVPAPLPASGPAEAKASEPSAEEDSTESEEASTESEEASTESAEAASESAPSEAMRLKA
jgi:hypothetical protein